MKKIAETIEQINTYQNADTTNYEGFPAWEIPLEKRFRQILFTGTFGNTFYADQKEIVKDGIEIIREGIKNLPVDYITSTIIDARNKGFIRTAPIIALILLREKDTKAFRKIFGKVIITGNDMEDFMRLSRALGKGFGRAVKSAIKEWLRNVNEFYAVKYKRQIADAMRIAHPDWDSLILDYIAAGFNKTARMRKNELLEKLPQVKAFEEAKKLLLEGKVKEALSYIKKGRVPATALLGVVSIDDTEYWTVLAEQMGVMQLLKYVNKLLSVGVEKEYIKKRLNPDALRNAKVLPLRLAIASRYVRDYEMSNYMLDVAVEYAKYFDWGKWNGKWVICPDISGSMTSKPRKGGIRPTDVAAVFSGILKAGIPDCKIIAWNTDAYDLSLMEPKQVIKEIIESNGGGTYMEIPVRYMIKKKIKADYVLIITDSEEWGEGWLSEWKKYKKANPDAKTIFIRVDPYRTQPYSVSDAMKYDIYDVFGWSDNVLTWIEEFVLSRFLLPAIDLKLRPTCSETLKN